MDKVYVAIGSNGCIVAICSSREKAQKVTENYYDGTVRWTGTGGWQKVIGDVRIETRTLDTLR